MRDDLGRHLFTFAVISDSHVNAEESHSVSPYACNRLANGRLRHVVHDLNRYQPAFTVHLGDMGNPLPELDSYERAAESFKTIAAELHSPLHLVPGNHCVGDKPTGWVPVPRVSARSLAQYERTYGQLYGSFDHGPCHFLILSSLIINSGLRQEDEQREWAERTLDQASRDGRRIWIMMHYPPYLATPEEAGSYDNVDDPGRSWLLSLLERYDVEAAYSGHVHNYFYNRYAGTDLITLPATSFVRQDYSDLFGVEPGDEEGGRNDEAKLGYGLVEVYEKGYAHCIVRTSGRMLAKGEAIDSPGATGARMGCDLALSWGGVDLCENWLATKSLRANNSVSPFTRRSARNDWAVLALKEMGISKVRLALQELIDEDVLERVSVLQEAGFEFLVYSHGVPGERAYRLVREHWALIAGWELIVTLDQVEATARRLAKITRSSGHGELPCYLNQVRDIGTAAVDDANVKHEANYGFQMHERDMIEPLARRSEIRETFRGLVFRLRRRGKSRPLPASALREIDQMGRAWGMHHQAQILFSGNLTAERLVDDLSTANRVAESALAGAMAANVDLWFDTFEDVDRGYFVRHGLVDRRYNPRLAARVLGHLRAALARYTTSGARAISARETDWGRSTTILLEQGFLILIAPSGPCTLREIEAVEGSERESLTLLDLAHGVESEVAVKTADACYRFERPVDARGPLLVIGASTASE